MTPDRRCVTATAIQLRNRIQALVLDLIARVILFNHAVAQREGLSGSDGQFLQLLRLHGPMTAGQLAGMAGLTTGSTTGTAPATSPSSVRIQRPNATAATAAASATPLAAPRKNPLR